MSTHLKQTNKKHQNFAAYQVIFFSLFIHFRQASAHRILILLKKTAGVKSTFIRYTELLTLLTF